MDASICNMPPDVEIRDFEPDKLVLKLRVTLSADRNAIDPVVESVMQIIREMKCVDGKESDI